MSDILDDKVRVVYEDGVFKPLQEIKLQEGTMALVLLKPEPCTDGCPVCHPRPEHVAYQSIEGPWLT